MSQFETVPSFLNAPVTPSRRQVFDLTKANDFKAMLAFFDKKEKRGRVPWKGTTHGLMTTTYVDTHGLNATVWMNTFVWLVGQWAASRSTMHEVQALHKVLVNLRMYVYARENYKIIVGSEPTSPIVLTIEPYIDKGNSA